MDDLSVSKSRDDYQLVLFARFAFVLYDFRFRFFPTLL